MAEGEVMVITSNKTCSQPWITQVFTRIQYQQSVSAMIDRSIVLKLSVIMISVLLYTWCECNAECKKNNVNKHGKIKA